MEVNDMFKKVMQAGLGLAVTTKERAEQLFDEMVEKGKEYQASHEEETETVEVEDITSEEETSEEEDDSETQGSDSDFLGFLHLEEIEQKVRKVLDNSLAKLNFAKNEENEILLDRINVLEEKLSQLADSAIHHLQEDKEEAEEVQVEEQEA